MAALAQQIPRVPFYFRIYSEDGNGIMYKAIEQLDADTYNCMGTRIIGNHNGYTIWEFGGYSDVMPAVSIHEVVVPRRLRKEEKNGIIRQEGLNPYLKDYDGFCDDTSYWFIQKSRSGRSRSRSGSSGSNNSKSKTRKSKGTRASGGKSRGKSRGY
jgi:hypothetical protein